MRGTRFAARDHDQHRCPEQPDPDREQAARIDAITSEYASRVRPATATGDGPWTVELWTVTDGSLVRHDLEVTAGGSITDTADIEVEEMPVPVAR